MNDCVKLENMKIVTKLATNGVLVEVSGNTGCLNSASSYTLCASNEEGLKKLLVEIINILDNNKTQKTQTTAFEKTLVF